jgi:quinol-cytochrome oxidoreductase complex cytochrome b subunit
VALTFLDRSAERHPLQRKLVMTIALIIGIMLLVLSAMGYIEHFGASHLE